MELIELSSKEILKLILLEKKEEDTLIVMPIPFIIKKNDIKSLITIDEAVNMYKSIANNERLYYGNSEENKQEIILNSLNRFNKFIKSIATKEYEIINIPILITINENISIKYKNFIHIYRKLIKNNKGYFGIE